MTGWCILITGTAALGMLGGVECKPEMRWHSRAEAKVEDMGSVQHKAMKTREACIERLQSCIERSGV